MQHILRLFSKLPTKSEAESFIHEHQNTRYNVSMKKRIFANNVSLQNKSIVSIYL